MRSIGRHPVIVATYVDGILLSTRLDRRTVYVRDRDLTNHVNWDGRKREVAFRRNGSFTWFELDLHGRSLRPTTDEEFFSRVEGGAGGRRA